MVTTIIKRDGRTAEFNEGKIAEAVERAFQACGAMQDRTAAEDIARKVVEKLESGAIEGVPTVEGVQDLVEETLIESGFVQTAKSYILYRAERSRARDVNSRLIQTLKDITFSKASDSDMKRENANIDADTAMGTMLKYGSESAKQFYEMCVIDPKFARAHREGDIHIHDMDFYTLTTTCCQIELKKLFKGGFSTGHGVLREPNDITSYAALACIAIQSNQNDQHGGQAICDFDYGLAEGVKKTYRRLYKKHLAEAVDLLADGVVDDARAFAEDTLAAVEEQTGLWASLKRDEGFEVAVREALVAAGVDEALADKALAYTARNAHADTDRATFQAMEALVHNLNTMHSRAGAQTPFSSVNYGMDTSPEGRMVVKNMLLATEGGLGSGETPIFPVQIFRVKEGVNYNPERPELRPVQAGHALLGEAPVPQLQLPGRAVQHPVLQGHAGDGDRLHGLPHARHGQRVRPRPRGHARARQPERSRPSTCRAWPSAARATSTCSSTCWTRSWRSRCGQLDERFEIQARKKVYNCAVPHGPGRVDRLREAGSRTTSSVRCSSTARCPWASSAWRRRSWRSPASITAKSQAVAEA